MQVQIKILIESFVSFESFKIELNGTDTIQDVKNKIHSTKGDDYKPELQKLILLGKVLEDNKTVNEYNINENSSIACFVQSQLQLPPTLLSGSIPQIEAKEESETESQAPQGGEATSVPSSGENPLAFLRSQPQFAQMRMLLQELAQSNPGLLRMINEHQNDFYNMLNEPLDETSSMRSAQTGTSEQRASGSYIDFDPAEQEAIERLIALGFSEAMCIQAYFEFEKNENLAANFLLSQNDEDIMNFAYYY